MKVNKKYRYYPEEVKREIIRTGNIYLFPQLDIPRSTAQYWLKNAYTLTPIEIDKIYQKQIENLQQEIQREKALRILLEKIQKFFPYSFKEKRVKSKTTRKKIVLAIKACLKLHKLNKCLSAIGLSKSTYNRWLSEVNFCKYTKGFCKKKRFNELTNQEILQMQQYIRLSKHAHVPIKPLSMFAKREGKLFCSSDTWYKYLKLFEWERCNKKPVKQTYKTGIRAKRVNEIWHIDATIVKLSNQQTFYIQVIMDNFSRFILAWQITESISAINTKKSLQKAREFAQSQVSTKIMMDGGGENNNHLVTEYIYNQNFKRLIAGVDIHYSNSIVEALFRSFKNNYLYHQMPKTLQSLKRKVNFYFNEHNEVIPHCSFNGPTPKEVYQDDWSKEKQDKLKQEFNEALQRRKESNQIQSCGVCL